jgi:CHRD domain
MRRKAYLWIGAAALAAALAAGSALAATSLPRQSSPTQNAPPGPAPPGPAKPPTETLPPLVVPLQAELSSRNVPTLQVASTATGRFIGALSRRGFTVKKGERPPNVSWGLFWVVAVERTTGPVTGVEIRAGNVRAAAGSTVISLCTPCKTTNSFVTGRVAPLTEAQLDALRSHSLFVNVMTGANPSGELRGQLARKTPKTTSPLPNTRMPHPLKPGQVQKITELATIPSS